MKTKRFISLITATVIFLSILSIPTFANENEEEHTHIEIIFEGDSSDEYKDRATHYFLNGEENEDDSCTYGIICQMNGHNLETNNITKITHKVNKLNPKCLEEIYRYSACTRCSYETSTLISSAFITCC